MRVCASPPHQPLNRVRIRFGRFKRFVAAEALGMRQNAIQFGKMFVEKQLLRVVDQQAVFQVGPTTHGD